MKTGDLSSIRSTRSSLRSCPYTSIRAARPHMSSVQSSGPNHNSRAYALVTGTGSADRFRVWCKRLLVMQDRIEPDEELAGHGDERLPMAFTSG